MKPPESWWRVILVGNHLGFGSHVRVCNTWYFARTVCLTAARLGRVCFIARNLCSLRRAALVELRLLRQVTAVQLVRLPDGLFPPVWESFLTPLETCGETLLCACTSQIPVQELQSGQRRQTAFLLRQRIRAETLTQTDSQRVLRWRSLLTGRVCPDELGRGLGGFQV